MSTGWAGLDASELVDILRKVARAFVMYDDCASDIADEVYEALNAAQIVGECPDCTHMVITGEVCLNCVDAMPEPEPPSDPVKDTDWTITDGQDRFGDWPEVQ